MGLTSQKDYLLQERAKGKLFGEIQILSTRAPLFIIQLQELMYDACYYHQTYVANNSCWKLFKDILLTLSPAELDWTNPWNLMEMTTAVFKILFKSLSI